MDKGFLERCLAEGLSLERIAERADKHPSTVSYHLRRHALVPIGHERHAPNAKVNPAALRLMIDGGATIREAAANFGVGYSTIQYWLKRLGIETRFAARVRRSREAALAGQTDALLECPKHGEARFVGRPDGNYRCSKCQSEAVVEWRRRAKRRLIARAGGCCQLCGYDRHPGALHFHHVDPSTKQFLLSRNGVTRSFREAAAEADKCVLLCGNCHAEVEAGVTELPANLTLKWSRG